jgi:lysophospholipase
MSSTTELVVSRAGHKRFQRRWSVEHPRAAVLLVHGMAEHSGRYEHVGEAFNAKGFDVLSFDLRGHGETEGRRGHVDSFDDFLDDVEELLEERRTLGVPVVLMAHSLGGLIACAYVIDGRPAPDLLVISAPALAADTPAWQKVLATAMSRIAPKLAIKNDFEGSLLSRDEAVGVAYRDDPLRVRVATARMGYESFAAMTATQAALHKITIPTYVLHGADDRLVPPSASEGFEQLPNATRVLHPGLRHESMNEPEQDEVIRGITDWIDEQLAR